MNENVKDTMTSHIVKEIKDIDNNVTGVIVPILRDTVTDYRKVVNKLIVIISILIIVIAIMGVSGYLIIAHQIEKYNEFLSQFDFESDDYSYIQDVDAGDGSPSTINDGINITKGD